MNGLTFTIFGGTGDLTFRKLLPALYNLQVSNKLDRTFRIVIIGRRKYTRESYGEKAKEWVMKYARLAFQESAFDELVQRIQYVQMDFTVLQEYNSLNIWYQQGGYENHIFYFAVAPRFFPIIAQGLENVEHACEGKVIVEKPFGENLSAARLLNHDLERFFPGSHIFHIDHYLGKEMVRNIQAVRFMNPIFKNVWNREFIEHVQISAMEEVGVESRGGYYDQSGALKDMVQNHLFQILTIIAMEQPERFFGDDMHQKQLDVLHDLRPVDKLDMKKTMVLGQYRGYRKEEKVQADSTTETYAALRLLIDNPRWQDVPFYIRTGKKLNRREMEVIITFKNVNPEAQANVLIIKIQPKEGIYLQFNIKKPGDSDEIIATRMDFCQSCLESNRINTPEAYERLLLAAVNNEVSWFSKWDQIETSWQYINRMKEAYQKAKLPIYDYEPGSDGVEFSKTLLGGQDWAELA